MKKERQREDKPQRPVMHPEKREENKPRSSAFNEPGPDIQKSTVNTEEADLEQERKDAMTERD